MVVKTFLRFTLQKGVRIYPNFLARRTVPQQTVYRSEKYRTI
jgi:hypothetical protein